MSITLEGIIDICLKLWYIIAITREVQTMDISTYFPIWNKLNASEQQALSANVRELHYHKGDLIYTGGDCMGVSSG